MILELYQDLKSEFGLTTSGQTNLFHSQTLSLSDWGCILTTETVTKFRWQFQITTISKSSIYSKHLITECNNGGWMYNNDSPWWYFSALLFCNLLQRRQQIKVNKSSQWKEYDTNSTHWHKETHQFVMEECIKLPPQSGWLIHAFQAWYKFTLQGSRYLTLSKHHTFIITPEIRKKKKLWSPVSGSQLMQIFLLAKFLQLQTQ